MFVYVFAGNRWLLAIGGFARANTTCKDASSHVYWSFTGQLLVDDVVDTGNQVVKGFLGGLLTQ
jgi:hypothetical protein